MAIRNLVGIGGLFKAHQFAEYPDGSIPVPLPADLRTPGIPLKALIADNGFGREYHADLVSADGERFAKLYQFIEGTSGLGPKEGMMIYNPDLPTLEHPRVIGEIAWKYVAGTTLEVGIFCSAVSNGVTWLNYCLFYSPFDHLLTLYATDFRNATNAGKVSLDLSTTPLIAGQRYRFKMEHIAPLVYGKVWHVNDPEPDEWALILNRGSDNVRVNGRAGFKYVANFKSADWNEMYVHDLTIESATARPLATRIEVAPDARTLTDRELV